MRYKVSKSGLTFLRQNDVLIQFTEEESSVFEELIVDTANGKVEKEQIAQFFKKCYRGPKLSEEKIGNLLKKQR